MRSAVLFILLILSTACTHSEAPTSNVALPPYTVVPPAGASVDVMVALQEAAQAWNKALGWDVFVVWHAGVPMGLRDHVYISEGTTGGAGQATCEGECSFFRIGYKPQFVSGIMFTHEFGHVLGLRDNDDENDLMFHAMLDRPRPSITAANVEQVRVYLDSHGFEL